MDQLGSAGNGEQVNSDQDASYFGFPSPCGVRRAGKKAKKEERKTKREEGKDAVDRVCGGGGSVRRPDKRLVIHSKRSPQAP